MLRRITLSVLLLLAWANLAHAEKRVALVIGNDAYESVPVLKKAVNDARTIASTLGRLGFDVIAAENLARRDMNRKIQQFANRVEPGDVAMVYYAGHGVEIDGENFLLPTDIPDGATGQEGFIKQESVGLNAVLDMLRTRRARLNLVILDACRNNPFSRSAGRGIGGTRGLARVDPPRGTFIMYSAGAGEEALDRLGEDDGNPNSVFTRTLVPLLTEPGRSLVSTAREVRREVRKIAAAAEHSQTPAYYDEVLGDFYFVPSAQGATAPVAADQIADDYRLAADIGTRAVWQVFLGRYGGREDSYYVRLAKAALDGAGGTSTGSDRSDAGGGKLASVNPATDPAAVAQCDRLAAHPSDAGKGAVEGVHFAILQTKASEAIAACRRARAKEPANIRVAFQLGRALYADGRYDEAISHYRVAAAAKYPKALSNLGIAYQEGKGVTRDNKEAVRLMREAAELGDTTAMQNLGASYHAGRGIERNLSEAERWLRKAADGGESGAMYFLAGMYDRGEGVSVSKIEAKRWYQKAAELGHPQAMTNLGYLHAQGVDGAPDPAEAFRWYRKAAEKGEIYGMNNLGFMYGNGQGVARDLHESVRWYRKAAEGGHVLAMSSLGFAYLHGTGIERDYTEAVRWLRQAADKDDITAMYNLGVCYKDGKGVGKDDAEAQRWFRKAADKGNVDAMFFVAWGYQNGQGVRRDLGEAIRWYRKAADGGSPGAMSNLGVLYANGQGVARDNREAVRWYRRAAEKGYTFAMYNLTGFLDRGLGTAQDTSSAIDFAIRALRSGEQTIVQDFDAKFRFFSQQFRVGVQRALRDAGVYQGKFDGLYGPQMREAVRRLAGR